MTDALDDLVQKERIAAVVNAVFVGTDARDWRAVEACFASSVLFDMASVGGGAPVHKAPAEIVAGWEAALAPIVHVHHQTGNVVVERSGETATVRCYGIAYHHRPTRSGRNTRVFVGSYEIGLARTNEAWLVDAFRFVLKFVDGNLGLEKEPGA